MNTARPSVEAAVEITMQMNFGSGVTYVRGGSTENV